MPAFNLTYKAHPTLVKFHHSKAFHRAIRGPRGSGKSTGCCAELFRRAKEQKKDPSGVSRTRWAIVRNTYRELSDTTVKTWLRWFPEDYLGKFNYGTMTHHIRWMDQTAGIDMDAEFLFRALDRPQDVKKTLSLELTGAYINESKEVPFGIISGLDDAIGRFPPKDIPNGFKGPTWTGMLLDTNSPDEDHWWFKLDDQFRNGDLDPKVWAFFTQPGGLIERGGEFIPNPKAENLENLPENYYLVRSVGKSKDHIRVYYCNQYGFVVDGKPVHPDYVDAVHCASELLEPLKNVPAIVGIDFGLTPAACFIQRLPNGRLIVFDELVTERMGITQFSQDLKAYIGANYPTMAFTFPGDPAGDAQIDDKTCFQILNAHGIAAVPAYHNNEPVIRRDALDAPLKRLIDGKPGFMVSPKCKVLRKALAGGFCYKRMQIVGQERYQDKPDKNKYSHIAEACEYACLGAGEGLQLITGPEPEQSDEFEMNLQIDHGAGDSAFGWMG